MWTGAQSSRAAMGHSTEAWKRKITSSRYARGRAGYSLHRSHDAQSENSNWGWIQFCALTRNLSSLILELTAIQGSEPKRTTTTTAPGYKIVSSSPVPSTVLRLRQPRPSQSINSSFRSPCSKPTLRSSMMPLTPMWFFACRSRSMGGSGISGSMRVEKSLPCGAITSRLVRSFGSG